MTRPVHLPDTDVEREVTTLGAGWSRRGDALVKTFAFERFADGIAFVRRLAEIADGMDHHPDIDIRYTKVTISLSTHSAGGITELDVQLARKAEEIGTG